MRHLTMCGLLLASVLCASPLAAAETEKKGDAKKEVTWAHIELEGSYYKNLFDLIGVKAEMLRVGEFKSAAEPYSRTEMSPEFRKEMEEILDDYYAQIVATIAKSRNLDPEKVKAAIDAGPQTARKA